MTRPTYGGGSGDFGADVQGGYFRTSGGTVQVWAAQTGGSPITDLQTPAGDAISAVTIPADGSSVAVKLPDGYTGEAWIGPSAGPRVRLTPPAGGGGSGASNSDVAGYVTGSGATKDALTAAFVARIEPASYTYNSDGTVATETAGGFTTTYAYNSDGTVHTATRDGVNFTYSYDASGNVTAVA